MKITGPKYLWLTLMAAPTLSQAYVGPGVGLSAIGSVLAFIGAVFLMIVGFLWYPIKRLLKRRSSSAKANTGTAGDDTSQQDGD